MPTGYTGDVEDGTLTEFPAFALRCARAFGALISMRDEPLDAPIPEDPPFVPSSYHVGAVARAKARLVALHAMSPEQVSAACEAAYTEQVEQRQKDAAERQVKNARHLAMRTKAEAWTPPGPDHVNLKEFMLKQLDSSVSTYEEMPPEKVSPEAWLAAQVAWCERDLLYHPNQIEQDRKRHEERAKWLRDLRKSL